MATVAERVEEIMGADFALVTGRFPDALVLALDVYSKVSPQVLSEVCSINPSTLAVALPSQWSQGFSVPKIVLAEETASPDSDGVAVAFTATDWALVAGSYQFMAVHNLESFDVLVQFIGDDNVATNATFDALTANSIMIFSNLPYAGRVLIKKVG